MQVAVARQRYFDIQQLFGNDCINKSEEYIPNHLCSNVHCLNLFLFSKHYGLEHYLFDITMIVSEVLNDSALNLCCRRCNAIHSHEITDFKAVA